MFHMAITHGTNKALNQLSKKVLKVNQKLKHVKYSYHIANLQRILQAWNFIQNDVRNIKQLVQVIVAKATNYWVMTRCMWGV